MDGNPLVGSTCVRGPATGDSSSFLFIVWTLPPDEFIFLMKINTTCKLAQTSAIFSLFLEWSYINF